MLKKEIEEETFEKTEQDRLSKQEILKLFSRENVTHEELIKIYA